MAFHEEPAVRFSNFWDADDHGAHRERDAVLTALHE